MTVTDATATAVIGVLSGAMGLLASETVAADGWLNVAGGLTSLGFAVWYAWYVTTKVMPEKDRVHKETIDGLVRGFREETSDQRASHERNIDQLGERIVNAIERIGK